MYGTDILRRVILLVVEQEAEFKFLGTWNQPNNRFKVSWTRLFFIFCQLFLPYLIIFQSFTAPSVRSTLKNQQTWQKRKENPCLTCVQPISPWYCEYPKSGSWVPIPPLGLANLKLSKENEEEGRRKRKMKKSFSKQSTFFLIIVSLGVISPSCCSCRKWTAQGNCKMSFLQFTTPLESYTACREQRWLLTLSCTHFYD